MLMVRVRLASTSLCGEQKKRGGHEQRSGVFAQRLRGEISLNYKREHIWRKCWGEREWSWLKPGNVEQQQYGEGVKGGGNGGSRFIESGIIRCLGIENGVSIKYKYNLGRCELLKLLLH